MMITRSKRRKIMTTTINYLSQDLIFFHILPRLPAKSLFKFTSVSKLWNNMIHDPILIASHYNHSKSKPSLVVISGTIRRVRFMYLDQGGGEGDQEEGASSVIVSLRSRSWKRLVGCINGLTCIRMRFYMGICNPTTHEMLLIPFSTTEMLYVNYGFGFDPLVNDHKVLLTGKSFAKIYTVGAGLNSTRDCLWRDVIVTSTLQQEWNEDELEFCPSPFICSNGALFKVIPRRNKIIIFDIHYEKFQVIPGLRLCHDQLRLYSISEFRECPYAVYYTDLEDGYEFRLYALKQQHQQQQQSSSSSWLIKECSYRIIHFVFEQAVHIPFKPDSNLIRFVENSGQILMIWISTLDGYIYVYNPHMEKLRKELSGLCSSWYNWNSVLFVRHVENLQSLKTLVPLLPLGYESEVEYFSSRETHLEENSAQETHPSMLELC